jgi:hypothetical protein
MQLRGVRDGSTAMAASFDRARSDRGLAILGGATLAIAG